MRNRMVHIFKPILLQIGFNLLQFSFFYTFFYTCCVAEMIFFSVLSGYSYIAIILVMHFLNLAKIRNTVLASWAKMTACDLAIGVQARSGGGTGRAVTFLHEKITWCIKTSYDVIKFL